MMLLDRHFLRWWLEKGLAEADSPLKPPDLVGLAIFGVAEVGLGDMIPPGSLRPEHFVQRNLAATRLVVESHPMLALRAGFLPDARLALPIHVFLEFALDRFYAWGNNTLVPALSAVSGDLGPVLRALAKELKVGRDLEGAWGSRDWNRIDRTLRERTEATRRARRSLESVRNAVADLARSRRIAEEYALIVSESPMRAEFASMRDEWMHALSMECDIDDVPELNRWLAKEERLRLQDVVRWEDGQLGLGRRQLRDSVGFLAGREPPPRETSVPHDFEPATDVDFAAVVDERELRDCIDQLRASHPEEYAEAQYQSGRGGTGRGRHSGRSRKEVAKRYGVKPKAMIRALPRLKRRLARLFQEK